MMRRNPQGDRPRIDKSAYVDPTAVVIGNVRIGKNVFVAPCAVIRADEPGSSISIGENCNIQDGVIIHALGDSSVAIGKNTSVSHGCIIHGPCTIASRCFIGFGSVVFQSSLKDDVFVRFKSAVLGVRIPARRVIPDGTVVDTAEKVKALNAIAREHRKFGQRVCSTNLDLLKGYKKGV